MGLSHADTIGQSSILGLCTAGRSQKSGVRVGFGSTRQCLVTSSIR